MREKKRAIDKSTVLRAVRLAIDNVLLDGLTDVFPRPFELDLLQQPLIRQRAEEKVTSCLVEALSQHQTAPLEIQPISFFLLPKRRRFDYRRCALIDPLDTVKYLALVLLVAETIEQHRIPVKRQIVQSYRYRPKGGHLFDSKYGRDPFKHRIVEKVGGGDVKVLVRCDIASFLVGSIFIGLSRFCFPST